MHLQLIYRRFNFIEKQIYYFSCRFTKINSFAIMKHFNFVDRFRRVVSICYRNINNRNHFNYLQKNVREIKIFENVFVKINYWFDRRANFDINMNLIFQKQIFVIWNHSYIVSWNNLNTFSYKMSHLWIIKRIIDIYNISLWFNKMFDTNFIFDCIFDFEIIFVNYIRYYQII